jgi:hypothetical protein
MFVDSSIHNGDDLNGVPAGAVAIESYAENLATRRKFTYETLIVFLDGPFGLVMFQAVLTPASQRIGCATDSKASQQD